MYDKQVVRRRRAVLAVLVALCIVLLTAYFGEGPAGALHGLQRGAQEVLAPIETGVSRATKPFRDLFGWVGDNLDAKDENERLKKENADLRKRVTAGETALNENVQLRDKLRMREKPGYPDGTDEIAAKTIGFSPTVWNARITIDKGSSDGLRVNQPVTDGTGLIGRVTSVTDGNAVVTLLIEGDDNGVSAQTVPGDANTTGGARGIVEARTGDPEDVTLNYTKSKAIKKGQTVITSGSTSKRYESHYPKGIPIGRVKRAEPDDLESGKVPVELFADFRSLETVFVLRAKPDNQDTDEVPNGIDGAGAPTP
jgi:rod shape-determining protein MreC